MSSSGARTISLHNTRYELQWRGDDLWLIGDGREVQKGCVRQIGGGPRWKASSAGYPVQSFPDEATARAVVEYAVTKDLGLVTDLT